MMATDLESQTTESSGTGLLDQPFSQTSLLELSFEQLVDYCVELGQPVFRAKQIWEWTYAHHVDHFDHMHNLPKSLRRELAQKTMVSPLAPIAEVVSRDGDTLKVLFRLVDGYTVEAVLMLYDKRRTLCISSQAGCAMGCTFCATAIGGLGRNLTAGEIIAQVLYFARYLASPHAEPVMNIDRPARVTNIVLMGMGEPMHNYNNVWTALRRMTDPRGFGLGARHITLSTVGLVPMIDRMAHEQLQIGLAVSLHAPNDELRSQLVPINRRYPLDALFAAMHRYIDITRRRITIEYALMNDINDSLQLARELATRLKPLLCHVNLIPLNPVPESQFQPTSDDHTRRFAKVLLDSGVPTTIRLRRGIEINAGCGQLQQAFQERRVKQ